MRCLMVIKGELGVSVAAPNPIKIVDMTEIFTPEWVEKVLDIISRLDSI